MYIETFRIPFIVIAAFALDYVIGDPQNPFHPIRIIGNGINLGIKFFRKAKPKRPLVQFLAGFFLSLTVIILAYTITKIFTWSFYRIYFFAGLAAEIILCYFLIAAKSLKDESMKVYGALAAGDIERARKNLSFIVGRDTQNLDQPAVVRASVETVSENLCDGVIAPLVFVFIGGAPLGMAYKAINTLDSMIGYRNDEFEYLGKFAARLDDAANFIPSRISALLMIFGSFVTGLDTKNAIRIFIRDRYKHKSPNSAQTESVCAGALGLCLGGDNYYNGALVHKPVIGDSINEPAPEHIIAANRLMYNAAISAVVLFSALGILLAFLKGQAYV